MFLTLPIRDLDPGLRLVTVDPDTSDGWSSYEHRAADVHRGVLVCTDARAVERPEGHVYRTAESPVQSLERRARAEIRHHYRLTPDRTFAFGLVYAVAAPPFDPAEIAVMVDRFEDDTGICLWAIAIATDPGSVHATHTWAQGFLFPLYDRLLDYLDVRGYALRRETKERRA